MAVATYRRGALATVVLMTLTGLPALAAEPPVRERPQRSAPESAPSAADSSFASRAIEAEEMEFAGPSDAAALRLAQAMAVDDALVQSARWAVAPTVSDAHATVAADLADWPRQGGQFALLTTGDADHARDPDGFPNRDNGGSDYPGRGSSVYDLSVLEITLDVPTGHSCLQLDLSFASTEYPEFLGSEYNDAFVAEVGQSTWLVADDVEGNPNRIGAPNNFATPTDGSDDDVISVNTIGVNWDESRAAEFGYNGAIAPQVAATPVDPGQRSLFLSIFDQGDQIYDSGVLLDNLRTGPEPPGGCTTGAIPAIQRPLVVLPGVLGSYLADSAALRQLFWPGVGLRPAFTALQSDGVTPITQSPPEGGFFRPPVTLDRARGYAGAIDRSHSRDVYAPAVAALESRGYVLDETLFVRGTDWRTAPSAMAADFWENWADQEPALANGFDILAHSQGGLVADEVIRLDDTGLVQKLATVGTPWLGAPETIGILLHGQPCKFTFLLPCGYMRGPVSDAFRFMPGVLELLPSQNHAPALVSGDELLLHGQTLPRYRERLGSQGQHLVGAAHAAQAARANDPVFDRVETLFVLGSGLDTIQFVEERPDDPCRWNPYCDLELVDSEVTDDYVQFQYGRGDGTVPTSSAEMRFAGTTPAGVRSAHMCEDVFGDFAEHLKMMHSSAMIDYVHRFFSGSLEASPTSGTCGGGATSQAAQAPPPGGGGNFTDLGTEPSDLNGMALDLLGYGSVTVAVQGHDPVTVQLPSPDDDAEPSEEEALDQARQAAALADLPGVSMRVLSGHAALFIRDVTAGAVTVSLEAGGPMELSGSARRYDHSEQVAFSAAPVAQLAAGQTAAVTVGAQRSLPESLTVDGETRDFGTPVEGADAPRPPRSTAEVVVEAEETFVDVVPSALDDSGIAAVQWRTDTTGPWTDVSDVTSGETVRIAAPSAPRMWVRVVSGAGLVEAPAHLLDLPTVSACEERDVPVAPFTDVGESVHSAAIDCVVWYAIAQGTTDTTYAPRASVRRDQMASFIARTVDASTAGLPPGSAQFADIDGNTHADNIERLAAAGIVQGVDADHFAPAQAVTRAQMASFIARAHAYIGTEPPAGPTPFTDIAGNTHEENIARILGADITRGVTPTTYGPGQPVLRDQMASFLARTLESLAGHGLVTLRE